MKKLLLLLITFVFPVFIFCDIVYPESLYIIDLKTGYKIMLGTSPYFIEREYNEPITKKLVERYFSPDYEYWSIIYDKFELWYDTYDMIINKIKIHDQGFSTSKGVKIGDRLKDIISNYGNPTIHYINSVNCWSIYEYHIFFKEINIDGLYTVVRFSLLNDNIMEIEFSIEREI